MYIYVHFTQIFSHFVIEIVSLIFVLLLFWGCSSCLLPSGLMIMKKGFDFQFNNMNFMIMFSFYDKLRHYFDHW